MCFNTKTFNANIYIYMFNTIQESVNKCLENKYKGFIASLWRDMVMENNVRWEENIRFQRFCVCSQNFALVHKSTEI